MIAPHTAPEYNTTTQRVNTKTVYQYSDISVLDWARHAARYLRAKISK
jgi:hypothetical protein